MTSACEGRGLEAKIDSDYDADKGGACCAYFGRLKMDVNCF